MVKLEQFRGSIRLTGAALAVVVLALAGVLTQPIQAQTFSVIHTFSGGADGATPYGSVTLDRAGNLYGTASAGGFKGNNCGSAGCGTVFKMKHAGSGWILTPLYSFQGNPDAAVPYAGVTVGPNGSLYGTTLLGGAFGDGAVFNLRPPAHFTANVNGGWSDTVLHSFAGSDGAQPALGSLIFDPTGNIYGTTSIGGNGCSEDGFCGTMFRLMPAGAGWTLASFVFPGGSGGGNPLSGVIRDSSGNLFGTTGIGDFAPIAYELVPAGSGWTENILYTFGFATDLRGGVIFDGSGGLFGATVNSTVYHLSPGSGQWTYNLLYTFTGSSGSWGSMIRDASGNLYGTTCADGSLGKGSIFKLTPTQGGGWTETDLYDFTGGTDGDCPIGGMALDATGNLYGTTNLGGGGSSCGRAGCGVVWQLTP